MSKVNEKDAAAATPETSVGEEKTNLAVSLGSSSSHAQPEPVMPFMPGSVFHANPCDFFLSIAGLLNVWLHDPSIKDIAKQMENDPSFNKMAEQFRQTFHGGDDGVRQFDIDSIFFTMEQQVMQNPQLMTMAKSLGTFIMQEQLGVRMARIKENPSLKPILEEIESGGPTVMMRYWHDEDVLKKVGEAVGLTVTEDATASAGHRVADSRMYCSDQVYCPFHHTLQELQQLDEGVKAMKAKLMSLQKHQQLKEENVKAQKAKLTSIQEKKRQIDMEFEVSRAELMSVLEQYQHNEQSEALKARLMNLQERQQEQQERQQLINHDIFTLSQIVATAEQEVAADKQRIAPLVQMNAVLEQRLAALEPRFAAKEQVITMANDSTEPMRARVGVSVAVTIGVFSHVYR